MRSNSKTKSKTLKRTARSIVVVCFMMVFAMAADAQCDGLAVACNNLVQVSLDTNCVAVITPDVILEDPQVDDSLYEVRVFDPDGNIIPDDTIRQDYNNVHLKVEVECIASGIYCWGYIVVEDKIKPSLEVFPEDTAVTCFIFDFDLDPNELLNQPPLFSDNGCEKPVLDFPPVDLVEENHPCADTIRVITRIWKVTDAAGNMCLDTQYIHILRADITDVVFPPDTIVDCLDEADLSKDKLGRPEIRSCDNFLVACEDIEIPVCGEARKILRIWKVTDTCTDEDTTHTQVIKIEDNYPPEFDFSFFEINPEMLIPDKHSCTATAINIPNPIITDCNLAQTTLEVFYQLVDEDDIPFGELFEAGQNDLELFDLVNVPIGEPFVVIFVANDGCGNISRDTSGVVFVEDTLPPNAVCEGNTTVVLNSETGEVQVLAGSFDDHSNDNCGVVRTEVRRLDSFCPGYFSDLSFQDKVHFCCSDIPNNPIRVVFRVYDAADNFSDCIVNVIVQDKREITITCPDDLDLDCDYDLDDLQLELETFYRPDVVWVCGEKSLNLEIPDYNLNSCGLGSFYVKWVAMDVNGQMDSCYQLITIENQSNPNISFPTDIFLQSCSNGTSPDELNSKPNVTNVDCEQIAVTYEDLTLTGTQDYCVKILRTWTVIDWCRFNGGSANSAVIASHEQTIKIKDNEAPDVLSVCNDFEVVDMDKDCQEYVEVIINASDDCTNASDLVYNYELDLDSDGEIDEVGEGNDVSRVYQVGHHTVSFTVEDLCGNISHCSFEFAVYSDKEPIPICQAFYPAELAANGQVTVLAEDLNIKSENGCGGEAGLTFAFNPEGTEDSRTYDCSDIPNGVFQDVEVNLWVIDSRGNKDFCVVTIALSDRSNDNCSNASTQASLQGKVTDEESRVVENIEVRALNTTTGAITIAKTDKQGNYSFGINMFDQYSVSPQLGGLDMTGVSTLDLVFIQRHILGLRHLDSPYKKLAADVNNSNSITASDLVELRRLILGTTPSLNQSWKFVRESHVFEENDPWVYPSHLIIQEVTGDVLNAGFIGLKVGDVNGNAFETLADVLGETRSYVDLDVRTIQSNDRITFEVSASRPIDIYGLQMALSVSPDQATLLGVEGAFLDINQENFSSNPETGMIRLSWHSGEKQWAGDEPLFLLHFRLQTGAEVPGLDLDQKELAAELYDGNLEASAIRFQAVENEVKPSEFTVFQNRPNPFNESTSIAFFLPDAGRVDLSVMDVSGKLIRKQSGFFSKGHNQISINKKDLNGSGVYYYSITTETERKSRRMIVLH